METSNIPKTFWHSLSICMLAVTFGLLLIAWNSSSVSIEIANAKIELSSALTKTREIRFELEKENEELILAGQHVEDKAKKLESLIRSKPSKTISIDEIRKSGLLARPDTEIRKHKIPPERFKALDKQIQSAEQAIVRKPSNRS